MLRSVLAPLPEFESDHRHQVGDAHTDHNGKQNVRWISRKNSAGKTERRIVRDGPSRQYQNKSARAESAPTLTGKYAKTKQVPAVLAHRKILKSVAQCTRQGGRGWILWLWANACPELKIAVPYYCGSHRCVHPDGSPTDCARHNAAVMFARMHEAFLPFDVEDLVSIVTTIDRNGFYGGKKWFDSNDAYRGMLKMNDKFMHRLRRFIKRMGWPPLGNRWVSVAEAHASGYPHMNLLAVHRELARYVREHQQQQLILGKSMSAARLFDGELLGILLDSGWGRQSSIENVRSKDCLTSYFAKVTQHQDAMFGELAKLTQTPLNAPSHFRRLRSGKGFLPPCRSNPLWTGAFVRMFYDPKFGYVAEAMRSKAKPPTPERNYELQEVERLTENIYHEDLIAIARGRPPPPRLQRKYVKGKEVKEPDAKDCQLVAGFVVPSKPGDLSDFGVRARIVE